MPSYEYRCRTCDSRFEVRRGVMDAETAVTCPHGHPATSRVFTAVAVGGTAQSGGSSGGGCCGGGCCG